MHATVFTLTDRVDKNIFAESALEGNDPHSAASQWKHIAANHWPQPLSYIEHIFAISALETYSQGVLFALLMAKNEIAYGKYSKDWAPYRSIFHKWRRGKSTQNIHSLLRILREDFDINIDLEAHDIERLSKANKNRNQIIHNSGHFNVSSSPYQEDLNKTNSEVKMIFDGYEFGKLPRTVYRAIKAIDKAIVESRALPREVLMYSSEYEAG